MLQLASAAENRTGRGGRREKRGERGGQATADLISFHVVAWLGSIKMQALGWLAATNLSRAGAQ
jgi:hypothetical protein